MVLAGQAVVDKKITRQLGEQTVRLVLSSLWPVDCQTCGRPFQGTRPALSIEVGGPILTAALHHQDCRASAWNDSGPLHLSGQALLSYRCNTIVLPTTIGDEREPGTMPIVVLNPGLEMLFLEKDAGGQWQIATEAAYAQAGLHRPPYDFDTPVPGVTAYLQGPRRHPERQRTALPRYHLRRRQRHRRGDPPPARPAAAGHPCTRPQRDPQPGTAAGRAQRRPHRRRLGPPEVAARSASTPGSPHTGTTEVTRLTYRCVTPVVFAAHRGASALGWACEVVLRVWDGLRCRAWTSSR